MSYTEKQKGKNAEFEQHQCQDCGILFYTDGECDLNQEDIKCPFGCVEKEHNHHEIIENHTINTRNFKVKVLDVEEF